MWSVHPPPRPLGQASTFLTGVHLVAPAGRCGGEGGGGGGQMKAQGLMQACGAPVPLEVPPRDGARDALEGG